MVRCQLGAHASSDGEVEASGGASQGARAALRPGGANDGDGRKLQLLGNEQGITAAVKHAATLCMLAQLLHSSDDDLRTSDAGCKLHQHTAFAYDKVTAAPLLACYFRSSYAATSMATVSSS